MNGAHRDSIFISYSHKDFRWLERLNTMLAPLSRAGSIRFWSDKEINPGNDWKQAINRELGRAKVAVLLASPNFLASSFISDVEFPALLRSSTNDDLVIIWVPISASLVHETELVHYQAATDPERPLDTMSPARRNQALLQV